MDKDIIFQKIKDLLISEFRIEAGSITPDSILDEELKLDSLDMVDLIICLNEKIDKKIELSFFNKAKTIQDVVDLLHPIWVNQHAPGKVH